MGLLSGDELRDVLDRAHKRAWERKVFDDLNKLQDKFKTLAERQTDYDERELSND